MRKEARPAQCVAVQGTDVKGALAQADDAFAGICGLHEMLVRHGMFKGLWCPDPREMFIPAKARST